MSKSVILHAQKGDTIDYTNLIYKRTMNGTIKTKTDRGFGFISCEGEAKDLFFYSQDLVGVTFDMFR